MQEAVKDKYIAFLVDECTSLLSDNIPAVIQYLFYNYSKVGSEEVSEKEEEVISIAQQLNDPIMLLIRLIENPQKLVQQAYVPYSS